MIWHYVRLVWFSYVWKLPELPLEIELQILQLKTRVKERCMHVQPPPDGLMIRPMEAEEAKVISRILAYDYDGAYDRLTKIRQEEDRLFWGMRRKAETGSLFQEAHRHGEEVWSKIRSFPQLWVFLPREDKWREAQNDCRKMKAALWLASLTEELITLGYQAAQKHYNKLQDAISEL